MLSSNKKINNLKQSSVVNNQVMKVEKQFEAIKKTKKNQHHPTSLLAVVYFAVAVV